VVRVKLGNAGAANVGTGVNWNFPVTGALSEGCSHGAVACSQGASTIDTTRLAQSLMGISHAGPVAAMHAEANDPNQSAAKPAAASADSMRARFLRGCSTGKV
jgi:hypothetical protein